MIFAPNESSSIAQHCKGSQVIFCGYLKTHRFKIKIIGHAAAETRVESRVDCGLLVIFVYFDLAFFF